MMSIVVGKKKNTHWEINEYELSYYTKSMNLFSKPKLEFKVYIKDIVQIEVYFISKPLANAALYGVGSYSHSIIFEIVLKNGMKKAFDIFTTVNRKEIITAISELQKLNVVFVDKYDLLSILSSNNKIYDEIEKIIIDNNLTYTNKKQ